MNINELNDAWIASGQKVSDMDAKLNALVMDDSFDETKFKDLKAKRDNEASRRDALKNQLEIERMANKVMQTPDKKLTPKEENLKDEFVNNFIGMIKGDPKVLNMVTSSVDENGDQAGLTIPADIQTTIHTLVRQYDALEQYVNHESVTTPSGSRVYEKWSDITPLTNLDDESATIGDNDDPKLMVIKYLIKRYAGITTVTNTLLKDTAENILSWLSTWIARKVVVTRNKEIIDVMNKAPKKPTLTKFDDIVTMINTKVDPAIEKTSFLMTNTTGFNVLSQVKDAMGRYLLQPDPKQPDKSLLKGKRIIKVADRWLPDTGNAHPLYYGDLKQAVTLFDRENMSLLATNIGAGAFEKDLYKIRVIDRFDVVSTDSDAWVAGSFTTIADQPANFSANTSENQ